MVTEAVRLSDCCLNEPTKRKSYQIRLNSNSCKIVAHHIVDVANDPKRLDGPIPLGRCFGVLSLPRQPALRLRRQRNDEEREKAREQCWPDQSSKPPRIWFRSLLEL